MTDVNPADEPNPSKLILGDKLYNILKFVALILLPAVGTLIFMTGSAWDLDDDTITRIVGTIMAIDTFLGVVLGISTHAYNNSDQKFSGAINLYPNPMEGTTDMQVNIDPNRLAGADEAILKVHNEEAV